MKNLTLKNKEMLSRWLSVILWVSFILWAVTMSIIIASSDTRFFMKQYKISNAAQIIGIDERSLEAVTITLQEYLNGKAPTLDVAVERNGTVQQFFNQREKDHMVDVLVLFDFARIVMKISSCVMIIIGILYCTVLRQEGKAPAVIKTYLKVLAVTAILVGIIAFFAVINFDKLWTFAHTVVFSNDLWLLDPNTDMLINLVPLSFFMAITTRIALIFGGILSVPLVGFVLSKLIKKANAKEKIAP